MNKRKKNEMKGKEVEGMTERCNELTTLIADSMQEVQRCTFALSEPRFFV